MENKNKKEEYIKIEDKVLNYIKEENIKSSPKWHFIIKNDMIWVLWLISILVGAISVSVLIFSFANAEWKYYMTTHGNFINFFIDFFPLIWIISLLIFIFIAYKNFKNTKRGYKYSIVTVVVLSIFVSTISGVGLYILGFGGFFDEEIGNSIPFYKTIVIHKEETWMKPGSGLFIGEVIRISPDFNSFTIKSPDGKIWFIDGTDLSNLDKEILTEFRVVRIIGIPLEKNGEDFATTTINGCVILPFEVMGQRFDEFGSMHPQKMNQLNKAQVTSERNLNGERSNRCKEIQTVGN